MNFADPTGTLIDSKLVEQHANAVGISLRSGCHCNPGAREVALGFTEADMKASFRYKDQLSYEEFLHVIDGKTTGAARASMGLASTFADGDRCGEFAASFRDVARAVLGRLRRMFPDFPLRELFGLEGGRAGTIDGRRALSI